MPTINMFPDIAAQQAALDRQQQIANLLRQQSLEQIDPNQVAQTGAGAPNTAVAISPFQGLAKMGQAYFAGKQQDAINAKQQEIAQALRDRMGGAFDQMLGNQGSTAPAVSNGQVGSAATDAGQFINPSAPQNITDSATSAALSDAASPALPAAPNADASGYAQALQAKSQSAATPTTDALRNSARAAYMMGDTDLANKLIENMMTLTPEQKNMAAMGQDPYQIGQLDTAAKRKAAMMEMQPGVTVQDLVTGQRTVAPNFNTGTQGGFDAQGRPVMGAIPGSGVLAQLAGQQAGAVAGAQANFKPNTVTLPNGQTIMASDAQLLGAAQNGGLQLQNPAQAEVVKATGTAAANAQKISAAAQPLLATIQEAKGLVNAVPSGPFGIAEGRADLANMPAIGNPQTASAAARWQQLMGQLTMNGIASSGLGRMDIPIVNAIKESSDVPMGLSPEAKLAKLNQLEKAIKDHVASVQNEVSGLNQPGITSTTGQVPMSPSAAPSAQAPANNGIPSMSDIQAEIARRQGLKQ